MLYMYCFLYVMMNENIKEILTWIPFFLLSCAESIEVKQPFTGLLQNGALAIVQYPTEEILWIAKKKKKT